MIISIHVLGLYIHKQRRQPLFVNIESIDDLADIALESVILTPQDATSIGHLLIALLISDGRWKVPSDVLSAGWTSYCLPLDDLDLVEQSFLHQVQWSPPLLQANPNIPKNETYWIEIFVFTHFQFPAGSNLHFSVALIKFWKCVLHWMCFEYTGRERHTQMHFQFQFSDHYWYWSTIIGRSLYMYTKKSNTIVFTKVQHNYLIGKVLSHTQILVKAP